jgi:hypothetical protein
MRQRSTILDVLSRLSLKRFGLSIDDFGTGHSSLAQLRDLLFNELKAVSLRECRHAAITRCARQRARPLLDDVHVRVRHHNSSRVDDVGFMVEPQSSAMGPKAVADCV